MTSDAQNKANRGNSQRSTGPASSKGLAISSQNARKHGVNAKYLVDPDEIDQYNHMMGRLKEKYPSNNPLVEMQLERIAKLNVQLKRIQQLIDAAFMLTKDYKISDEILMDRLQMNETEKISANRVASENAETDIIFDLSLMELAAEIDQIDTESFKSPQDFLTHTPNLCQYLHEQASRFDVSIGEYISNYLKSQQDRIVGSAIIDKLLRDYVKLRQEKHALEQENQELKQGLTVKQRPTSTPIIKSKEDAILSLKVKDLKEASKFLHNMINDRLRTNHKLYAFSQIRKIEQNPLALEHDNLDKLFRYQTSIQRQLSSAIGELIYINKS